jgi:hypothetical protein
MSVYENLDLMAKLTSKVATNHQLHLSKATGITLRAEVAKMPYNPQFTHLEGTYYFQKVPLIEDENVPEGEIILVSEGGVG